MVKVSVIMPSLNVGGYIEEALESVREQTLGDIEIICVDAGSTDGTWETIQAAAKEDGRVTAVRSQVKSLGYQVNMGLGMARGKYAAILETDDFIAPDMYGSLYRLAEAEGLDFAKCDYDAYVEGINGKRDFIHRKVGMDRSLYVSPFMPRLHPETAVGDWYLWNGIYRTGFLRENRIRLSENAGAAFPDIGFLHKTNAAARRVQYLGRSLYRYCIDREGASSRSGRALSFIRAEYGFLLDGIGGRTDAGECRLLYRRMAKSFVLACMDSSDGILRTEQGQEACGWFRVHLGAAERKGLLGAVDLPAALQEGYRHMMDPAGGFTAYRGQRQRAFSDFLGAGEPVIIFGCGAYGREACKSLRRLGFVPRAFMDNDAGLWGQYVEGIRVIAPGEASRLPMGTGYVVANEGYAEEIIAQLSDHAGIPRTFVYAGE